MLNPTATCFRNRLGKVCCREQGLATRSEQCFKEKNLIECFVHVKDRRIRETSKIGRRGKEVSQRDDHCHCFLFLVIHWVRRVNRHYFNLEGLRLQYIQFCHFGLYLFWTHSFSTINTFICTKSNLKLYYLHTFIISILDSTSLWISKVYKTHFFTLERNFWINLQISGSLLFFVLLLRVISNLLMSGGRSLKKHMGRKRIKKMSWHQTI